MMVPITAGMIALAYNIPGVNSEIKLPRDVYVDIFAGAIQQWDDPRIQKQTRAWRSLLMYRDCRAAGQQRDDGSVHAASRGDRSRVACQRNGRRQADRLAKGDDACAGQ